jgi:hypothetical protein
MLSPAVNEGSTGRNLSNLDGVPDDYGSISSNDMFNLKFRDVTGLDKGFRGKSPFGHYGDSENYFCVISDEIAYCHKRDVAYTPATAVLVAEGERRADNPGGSLSKKEKFVYWRHLKQKGILDAKLPNDGMVYYALKHEIVSRDELKEEDGTYGKFETLHLDNKCETLAKIGDDHGFDITWENYHNAVRKPDTNGGSGTPRADDKTRDGESDSSGSAESSSGRSGGSGEQSSAGESGGTESATSSASASESSATASQSTESATGGDPTETTDDDAAEQTSSEGYDESLPDAGDVTGGAPSSELFDDASEVGNSDAEGSEQEGNSEADDSGTTKFHTYEEPSETGDEFDVDVEAVSQFTSDFCLLESDDDTELKTHKGTLLNAFNTWANLNDIELDELGEDVWINHRKGNLKQILKHLHDLAESKYTVADERAPGFGGIELSEVGKELLDIDT